MSGISTIASGIPIRLRLTGQINSDGMERTTSARRRSSATGSGAFAPVYVSDPRTGDSSLGDKLFDINAIRLPNLAAGEIGDINPPYNLRYPTRMNHDLTIFKDFRFANDQRLQFRVGFFNLFNMAYAGVRSDLTNDIDLTLETQCNVTVNGVPNGAGGISRQRLRPDRRLPLHRQHDRQLRQDQPAARPPRGGVRAEVLLLSARRASDRRAGWTSPGPCSLPVAVCECRDAGTAANAGHARVRRQRLPRTGSDPDTPVPGSRR